MKCISENEKQNVTVIYVDMHILLNPPSSDMMRLVVWIIETKPRFTYFLHQVNKMDIVPDFTDTSCVTYSLLHWSHIVMALNRFLDSVSAVAFSRDYLPLTGVERVPGIVFGGWILKNVKSRKVTIITFPSYFLVSRSKVLVTKCNKSEFVRTRRVNIRTLLLPGDIRERNKEKK